MHNDRSIDQSMIDHVDDHHHDDDNGDNDHDDDDDPL